MDGRDGIFKPKKYNSLHFMSAPEIRKVPDLLDKNTNELASLNGIFNQGVLDSTEAALISLIGKRKDRIEKKFGQGSSDWLLKNLNMFDPEERYKLYYMFEGMAPPPGSLDRINANPVDNPNQKTNRPLSKDSGGVRG